MKTIKSLVCAFAAVAALAFFTTNARAIEPAPGIGITTNFSALSVSFVVITNGPEVSSGNTETGIIGKSTINNTFLLNLFAHWDNTNWPAGSKLEIGWDTNSWNGDVIVADKTGTNVLYDASVGTNNFFAVDYFEDPGADYNRATLSGTNSFSMLTYTDYDDGACELYDDGVYLPYTDLYLFGGTTVTFTQSWTTQGVPTTWHATTDLTAAYNANMYFLGYSETTVSGTVNANGSGKGINNYLYSPDFFSL